MIDLAGREAGRDELTERLRNGVRTLIAGALEALLGLEAKGLSAVTVSRLKLRWAAESIQARLHRFKKAVRAEGPLSDLSQERV